MNDPKILEDQPDLVKAHLSRRHAGPEAFAQVDRIVGLSKQRKEHITERDALRNQRNLLSKQIGDLMKAGSRDAAEGIKATVNAGNVRVAEIEAQLETLENDLRLLAMSIPNLLNDDVPEGKTEHDNPVLRAFGATPVGDPDRSHVEIGEKLGIIDLERAAKLSGTRFAVLKGPGARLERALINFFLDLHTGQHGYTEVMVPYMVHRHIMEGTGQLPKFENDSFKLSEKVNGHDMFLVPTAEVPVTNLYRDEILPESQLPLKMACFTPCFRAEAGSAGRDVRGLIRQHQFHKVELVWITTPERGLSDHETLVGHAEACLKALELPYRVVQHCGGEVGFSATRAFDFEVWLPSQGKYREISSVSWFRDFQARRMQLRYRPGDDEKVKPRFAHTLNGSGLAVGRTLVAILENYAQADGSVVVPKVLQPYVGTDVIRPH